MVSTTAEGFMPSYPHDSTRGHNRKGAQSAYLANIVLEGNGKWVGGVNPQ
jgi:hypothetical protein